VPGYKRGDPTSDSFMKSEDKAGGPLCPATGFEEVFKELFAKRYSDYTQHPMFAYLAKYKAIHTPTGDPNEEGK